MAQTKSVRLLVALAGFLKIAGCDDEPPAEIEPDLSVSGDLGPPRDLAAADFSTATDLGGWCSGTALESSCAYPYLEQLARCFHPTGDCYERLIAPNDSPLIIWENCAYWLHRDGVNGGGSADSYRAGEASCARIGPSSDQVTVLNIQLTDPAASLTYDTQTGIITCPGGAQSNIGNDWGGCAAFEALRHGRTGAATGGPTCGLSESPPGCYAGLSL